MDTKETTTWTQPRGPDSDATRDERRELVKAHHGSSFNNSKKLGTREATRNGDTPWASSLCTFICCPVAQSCPILCDPVDCSTPGFPVWHKSLYLFYMHKSICLYADLQILYLISYYKSLPCNVPSHFHNERRENSVNTQV